MKKYLIILSLLLVAEVGFTAPGPLNFTPVVEGSGADGVMLIRVIKPGFYNPVYLFKSISETTNADHNTKAFAARSLLRLPASGEISSYEQKMLRNQICASNLIHTTRHQDELASSALYLYNDHVVSIESHDLLSRRLSDVLRSFKDYPVNMKRFIAQRYIVNIVNLIEFIINEGGVFLKPEINDILINVYNGYISIRNFTEAKTITGADTAPVMLSYVMKDLVPEIYNLLFSDPVEAIREYTRLLTLPRGSDLVQVAPDLPGARAHAWTMNDIKQILVESFGPNAFDNGVYFGNGLLNAGENAQQNAAGNVARFNTNAGLNYLNINIPWYSNKTVYIDFSTGDHEVAVAGNRGNNNFGIDDAVRLLIKDNAGNPYADLATMCGAWTGRE